MPGTVNRRCHCKDPETGKELGSSCPARKQSKHGEWEYRDRLTTSNGRRSYRRGGFPRRADAEEHGRKVHNLIALAHDEPHDVNRVGDMLFKLKRGARLPEPDEIRRKLGLKGDLTSSVTVASWLDEWLQSKKRNLRDTTWETYDLHIRIYLTPMLGHIPLDRLRPEHIDEMLDRIYEWNAEIADARAEGRRPAIEGYNRARYQVIKNNTIRRVLETLRNSLNAAIDKRRISISPLVGVEWPSPDGAEAKTWTPQQVAQFLDFVEAKGPALTALFQIILIHGPRRGEILGARWSGFDEQLGLLEIRRTYVSLAGGVGESTPKTPSGKRDLYLDKDTCDLLRRIRVGQAQARLQLGEAYHDDDLIFCKPTGEPWSPRHLSRMWRTAVDESGLPRIKLHEGRHTAATLSLEAGVDIKVVSKRMGHSKTGFTRDTYQHVRPKLLDDASSKVVDLVERQRRRRGSDVADGTG